jgi:hypothetical protein
MKRIDFILIASFAIGMLAMLYFTLGYDRIMHHLYETIVLTFLPPIVIVLAGKGYEEEKIK